MNGDLTVTGQILADGGFEFGDAISVDLIRESSTGVGVTIEGVHFIDGGLDVKVARGGALEVISQCLTKTGGAHLPLDHTHPFVT